MRVKGPSWWRGDRRVADACRAQVSLRDVLLGHDIATVKAQIDRLQTIGVADGEAVARRVVGRAHGDRARAGGGRRSSLFVRLGCARRRRLGRAA